MTGKTNKLFQKTEIVGSYQITYNWSSDSFFFEGPKYIADIKSVRLTAFGYFLRSEDFNDKFIEGMLESIYQYEQKYGVKIPGIRKLK